MTEKCHLVGLESYALTDEERGGGLGEGGISVELVVTNTAVSNGTTDQESGGDGKYDNDDDVIPNNIFNNLQFQSDNNHEEKDKTTYKQIFSEVVAIVSENVLRMIPSSKSSFFEALHLEADVEYRNDKDNDDDDDENDDNEVGFCTIRGNLEQIIRAQTRLEKYLFLNDVVVGGDGGSGRTNDLADPKNVKCFDKGVMCDIIKLDRLSHFALEHPRRARFSSLLLRQPQSSSAAAAAVRTKTYSAIKAKYSNARTKVKRRKVIVRSTTTRSNRVTTVRREETQIGRQGLDSKDECKVTEVYANVGAEDVINDVKGHENEAELIEFEYRGGEGEDEDEEEDDDEERGGGEEEEEEEDEDEDREEEEEEDEGTREKSSRRNYEELTPFKFFCKQCSFKTKRKSHYQKHLLIHDKVKTLYNCDNCSFMTIRLSHLRRHEMAHSQTTYDCEQCSYKTDEVKLLHRHIKLKHKREGGDDVAQHPIDIHQCPQCPYKTTKPYHFKRHLKVHDVVSKSSSIVYRCDQCNYKTNRKEHYIRHVNNVHSNTRPYLCDFCGKAFKRPDALKQHRLTHGETDSRLGQFKCGVCQKKCRSQAHLTEHQTVHSNIRSFLCEICGASFKTRSVQRKHVLTIHKNPRSHSCEHCPKRFNTNYALRRHVRLHEDNDHNLTNDNNTSNNLIVTSPLPSNILVGESLVSTSPIPFADSSVASTLSLALRPHVPSSLSGLAATDMISADGSMVRPDVVVEDGSTLVTIHDSVDLLQQIPQTFIQTEASTALLYLTTNFTHL